MHFSYHVSQIPESYFRSQAPDVNESYTVYIGTWISQSSKSYLFSVLINFRYQFCITFHLRKFLFLCPLYYSVNCSTSCFFRLSISLLTTFLNRITFTRTLSSSFLHFSVQSKSLAVLPVCLSHQRAFEIWKQLCAFFNSFLVSVFLLPASPLSLPSQVSSSSSVSVSFHFCFFSLLRILASLFLLQFVCSSHVLFAVCILHSLSPFIFLPSSTCHFIRLSQISFFRLAAKIHAQYSAAEHAFTRRFVQVEQCEPFSGVVITESHLWECANLELLFHESVVWSMSVFTKMRYVILGRNFVNWL